MRLTRTFGQQSVWPGKAISKSESLNCFRVSFFPCPHVASRLVENSNVVFARDLACQRGAEFSPERAPNVVTASDLLPVSSCPSIAAVQEPVWVLADQIGC